MPRFYPFEARIIEEVKSRLNNDAAVRLQQQADVINKVQRLARGKEVNLYHVRHGKVAFDDNLRFPTRGGEALLATVSVGRPQDSTTLDSEIWLADGRLFSLLFNKAPKDFFGRFRLTSVQPAIARATVWLDPMSPGPLRGSIAPSSLQGWVKEWYEKGLIANLRAPLTEEERAVVLARLNCRLPSDYLELVAQTEGATVAGIVVYGLAQIRKVVSPEENYYVLADDELVSGVLAAREGDTDGELCFLDPESEPRKEGSSLEKALAEWIVARNDAATRK